MTGACSRHHNKEQEEMGKSKKVSDGELDQIVERLYKTHTKSMLGEGGEQTEAKDVISKKKASNGEVDQIVTRLYKTQTKAQLLAEEEPQTPIKDEISKEPVSDQALDEIIHRLHTTHTESSGVSGPPQDMCSNIIAKEPCSEEEMQAIYGRLAKTHTKSSSGGEECRTMEPPKPPGYGLKMYPVIDGIETRFVGGKVDPDKAGESMERLVKTQTTSSQARLDNPRILLYPERTTLMNNVDRIRSFQESGMTTKQKDMQRREKWFN